MVLFTLCTLDLVSSAWLFQRGLATEANPLLYRAAEAGVVPFVLAKLTSYVPALIAAEWLWRRHPITTQRLLRFVICAYILIYGVAVGRQFLP